MTAQPYSRQVDAGDPGADACDTPSATSEREAAANAALLANSKQMAAVLLEAAQAWAESFERDEPISGADLMAWFAAWRVRALAVLDRAGAP